MPRHTQLGGSEYDRINPKWQVQREYFSRIRSNEFQLLRPTTEYKDEEDDDINNGRLMVLVS